MSSAAAQADDGPLLTDALADHLGMARSRAAVVSKEVIASRWHRVTTGQADWSWANVTP